jgi:hypothetical protein
MRLMIGVFDIFTAYRQLRIGTVCCGCIFGGCCEYAFSVVKDDIELACITFANGQQLVNAVWCGRQQ